jgi:hypothetical protein
MYSTISRPAAQNRIESIPTHTEPPRDRTAANLGIDDGPVHVVVDQVEETGYIACCELVKGASDVRLVSVISASGTVSRYDEVGLLVWTSTGFDWLRLRTSRGSGMEVAVDTVTAR